MGHPTLYTKKSTGICEYFQNIFHWVLSLKNPSPLIRTSGLKVFNEILYTNFIPIKEIISKINNNFINFRKN